MGEGEASPEIVDKTWTQLSYHTTVSADWSQSRSKQITRRTNPPLSLSIDNQNFARKPDQVGLMSDKADGHASLDQVGKRSNEMLFIHFIQMGTGLIKNNKLG